MGTHQPVNDTARAELVYGFSGGPDIISGFAVRDAVNPWNSGALSDLADSFESFWTLNLKPLQVDALMLREIRCADLENEFGARFVKTVAVSGDVATPPAPGAVAAIVHFLGDAGSAPRKGTVFSPGIAEAQITDQALDPTFASDLQDAYDVLRSEPTFHVSWALVLISRYQGTHLVDLPDGRKVKRPTKRNPATTNTTSGVQVPTRYGVQRRRRPSPL